MLMLMCILREAIGDDDRTRALVSLWLNMQAGWVHELLTCHVILLNRYKYPLSVIHEWGAPACVCVCWGEGGGSIIHPRLSTYGDY